MAVNEAIITIFVLPMPEKNELKEFLSKLKMTAYNNISKYSFWGASCLGVMPIKVNRP